jgi:cation diffusion facilitator family transporter
LITCVWIIYEATQRLFYKPAVLDISIWAFLVMAISIVIDINRSRMLYQAARKHNSQALEADALHFRTDIWSSSVVILGLICVKIGEWVPALAFLDKADAVAALGVALIVVYISVALGMRTIHALLDVAPPGMVERITAAAEAIPGVTDCHQVRLRHSGPRLFVDLHVLVDGKMSLQEAHRITEVIEEAIREIVPDADVTVHAEPAPKK